LVVLLLATVHIAYYAGQLPENMATHFDGAGGANGFDSKASFLTIYAVTMLGLAGMFIVIAFSIQRLPVSMINLPNRDYWLSGDRAVRTRLIVGRELLRFGSATLLFFVAIIHLTIQANLNATLRLGSAFWVIFTLYMFYTLVWTLLLMRRFRMEKS